MKALLTLAFAMLLIGAGAALAQTPDHIPPALETVCDMETGAAYGLCNAYCEAMDCETANPSASATACSKVRNKFEQTTGRHLPCESLCPCADVALSPFAQVLTGQIAVDACFTRIGPGSTGIVIYNPEASPQPDFPYPAYSIGIAGIDQWICGLPNSAEIGLPISPAQGQYCAQLLEQYANSQGVTCGPPPV